ncbi:MAG: hypothetical protein JWM69_310, partial [Candidatus Binatus sp.]|nr:hypothetical protein [Candidatus Binatus sp.]
MSQEENIYHSHHNENCWECIEEVRAAPRAKREGLNERNWQDVEKEEGYY